MKPEKPQYVKIKEEKQKELGMITRRASYIRAKQRIVTLNNSDSKKFLHINNLSNENLARIREKAYDEDKERLELAKIVSND